MLIADTLFDYIKNNHGLECFPVLRWHSIRVKRYHMSKTPAQKQAFSELMSDVMKKVRRDYMDNITSAQKSAFAERMRKGQKKYWKNVSEDDRKIHTEKMSKGMKKAWCEGRVRIGTRESVMVNIMKIGSVEENIPRVNTYSGVITESDMESL